MQKEIRPVKYRKTVILPKVKLLNGVNWLLKEKYNGKLTAGFKKDVGRLEKGEPLDYVIGFTEFLGCKVDLSKKPLIPRPETEFWAQKAVDEIRLLVTTLGKTFSPLKVLDMFAGSGCIGVSIVRQVKNTNVVFAEKDKKLVEQIEVNCRLNDINKDNYKVIQSDVFSNVTGKFDYIFANPPYIPDYRNNASARLRTILRNRIQASVLKYEPKEALFGGGDGLAYIKRFLAEAKSFLKPKGKIFMEFDYIQKNKINTLLKKYHYKNWKFQRDQHEKWRWVVIVN